MVLIPNIRAAILAEINVMLLPAAPFELEHGRRSGYQLNGVLFDDGIHRKCPARQALTVTAMAGMHKHWAGV